MQKVQKPGQDTYGLKKAPIPDHVSQAPEGEGGQGEEGSKDKTEAGPCTGGAGLKDCGREIKIYTVYIHIYVIMLLIHDKSII